MTRKKVTLAYISNDSERKASYKKRKKGLMKKVSELSTLCGVDACAIIYSQYDAVPEVWPSPLGAQAILARFRKLSEMDQTRKMVNQESFTRQRIKKAEEQLRRLRKDNRSRELEGFMFRCINGGGTLDEFDISDAAEMASVVSQTLRDIKGRMEMMRVDRGQRRRQRPAPAEMEMVMAPPPPAAEHMATDENMEGFPWDLVRSPTGGGGAGLGWDDGMVLPYPYIFNHSNFAQFGNSD